MKKAGRFAGIIFTYMVLVAAAVGYWRGTRTDGARAYVQTEQECFVLAAAYQDGQEGYVMYRLADGGREELFRLFPPASYQVTDVSAWEGELVIAGIDRSAGEVILYRYPSSEQGGQIEKERYKGFSGLPPGQALYREGSLYVADPEGVLYLENGRSTERVFTGEADTAAAQRMWKDVIRNNALIRLAVLTAAYALLCIALWLLSTRVWKGRRLAVSLCISTIVISGVLCLLVFIVAGHLALGMQTDDVSGGQITRALSAGCLAVWLAFNLLMTVRLFGALRPVCQISRHLDRLLAGERELMDGVFPDNELGDIAGQLSRLGKAWEIQQYTAGQAMRYYARFAPAGFERLLGKESIQELKAGDTAPVSGTMELIFVPAKQGQEGVSRLNLFMEELAGRRYGRTGVLLGGNRNFDRIRVLYEESGDCPAVLAGLELMASRTLQEAGIQPFVLLHTCDMICGLVGNRENVYPYVDCPELDELERYCPQLEAMGVHMLITEAAKRQTAVDSELRYIGYIRTEGGERFRLYEVLDACFAEEKSRKQATAERFARALELFYEDNFYLARMYFTEVLKGCPRDGVARWYLFACETLFNMENPEQIRHHLFF